MDHASKVPPPVYSPYVVANAILHAAENRTRDLVIGGSGASFISLVRLMPHAADKLLDKMFFLSAVDRTRPPREDEALHKPGDGGHVLGDQKGYMMKSSAYTQVRKHPAATLALGAATLAALIAARHRRNGTLDALRAYLHRD